MGEISKRTGELGEDAAVRLLHRIGWVNGQENVSIPCNDTTKHPGRESHGIDYLKLYPCPLIQQRLVHGVVSIKATKGYDKHPNSKFKSHLKELSDICNCYNRSDQKGEISKNFLDEGVIESESIVGILIWLSDLESDEDRDLKSETSTAQIDDLEDFQFEASYLVDLKQAEFLWQILSHADQRFTGWEFLYIETGLNFREDIKIKSGSILPVEYINSTVIPMKYSTETGEHIILYTGDRYDEEDLKKYVGMANKLSSSFAGTIEILFPDYKTNGNENSVRKVLDFFSDQSTSRKIRVSSYADKLIQ
ncbi:GapS4a family protein [Pedobacter mucosus]|uniref:GapS4a family protein n=1 Tax=Pedobacter mucosus TaxID=2895286 RepID=UPI001EE3F892|nr:hypothetical protein [Pedobacter mucosus]UKT64294.1 hypothetical protein LOK61_00615 [Pedobacter mucosus]